jgi:hypothetical protein
MAPLKVAHKLVGCSSAEYWRLAHDEAFRRYQVAQDGNVLVPISQTQSRDADGHKQVVRVTKIAALRNPVPAAIRKVGGLGEEFFFTITETFWPDVTDDAHRLTFSTEPPVLASRIIVVGSHWAEALNDHECVLHWELDVAVRVMGVGSTIAKGSPPAGFVPSARRWTRTLLMPR